MPPVPIFAMRSFQISAVPILWPVSQSTSAETLSLWFAAIACAISPPTDRPTMTAARDAEMLHKGRDIVGMSVDVAFAGETAEAVARLVVPDDPQPVRHVRQ